MNGWWVYSLLTLVAVLLLYPTDRDTGDLTESAHAKPLIAVLPFTNLSDDPQQECFSDGLYKAGVR